ncbi:hypothetical protein [Deinococcus maricopensis]|nr:hypothetical protein [Deinococcus maricopensis]
MRKFTTVLTALVLASCTGALAAATGTSSVTAINSASDELSVNGNMNVNFTNGDFGVTYKNAGFSTLTYSTHDNSSTGNRLITVGLAVNDASALPEGVTLKLTPTVPDGNGVGTPVNFSGSNGTAVSLITDIPQFLAGATANVAYSMAATKGFNNFSGTLTYTIGLSF